MKSYTRINIKNYFILPKRSIIIIIITILIIYVLTMSLTENQISELDIYDDDSGDESDFDDDPSDGSSDESLCDSEFEGSFSNNLRTTYF